MPDTTLAATWLVRLYLRSGATIVLTFPSHADALDTFEAIATERRRKATGLVRIVGEENTTLASVEREAIEAVTLAEHAAVAVAR